MECLLDNILCINESVIDFPREDLPSEIWIKREDNYTLRPEARDAIYRALAEYRELDLVGLADRIHITGSIGTNQYTDDADVDVHLIIDESKLDEPEKTKKRVFKFFKKLDRRIGTHPIEVYLQFNPRQELLAEACYDMTNDVWIKGPKIVPPDYDPYEDFSDLLDDIRDVAEDADKVMGELKRDVIDYSVIEEAIRNLSGPEKVKLLKRLKDKLDEIDKAQGRVDRAKKKFLQDAFTGGGSKGH